MSACSTCKFYSSGQFSNRCELDGSENFITPETCYMKDKIDKERADAIDELTKALCEYNLGIKMYTLEELEGIWADIREIAEKVKEQKNVRV